MTSSLPDHSRRTPLRYLIIIPRLAVRAGSRELEEPVCPSEAIYMRGKRERVGTALATASDEAGKANLETAYARTRRGINGLSPHLGDSPTLEASVDSRAATPGGSHAVGLDIPCPRLFYLAAWLLSTLYDQLFRAASRIQVDDCG